MFHGSGTLKGDSPLWLTWSSEKSTFSTVFCSFGQLARLPRKKRHGRSGICCFRGRCRRCSDHWPGKPSDGSGKQGISGQIVTTSQGPHPKMVVKSKGNPLISGKSGLVKYDNLTRKLHLSSLCRNFTSPT